MFDKKSDHGRVTLGAGHVEGGEVVVVPHVDREPGVYQELQPVDVVVHDGAMNGAGECALVLVKVAMIILIRCSEPGSLNLTEAVLSLVLLRSRAV